MCNLCPVQLFPREEDAPIVCNCDPWLPLYSAKSPPSSLHVLELDVIILPLHSVGVVAAGILTDAPLLILLACPLGNIYHYWINLYYMNIVRGFFFYKMVFLTATQRDWHRKCIIARILKKTSLARKELSKSNISHSILFHENLPVSHGTMMEQRSREALHWALILSMPGIE